MNLVEPLPVPLVGQPVRLNEFFIIASITCTCRHDNAPMLIPGTGMMATCRHCQKSYIIGKIDFDYAKGMNIHGSIGCVLSQNQNGNPSLNH